MNTKNSNQAMNQFIRGQAGRVVLPAPGQAALPTIPPGNAGAGTSQPPRRKINMNTIIRIMAGKGA